MPHRPFIRPGDKKPEAEILELKIFSKRKSSFDQPAQKRIEKLIATIKSNPTHLIAETFSSDTRDYHVLREPSRKSGAYIVFQIFENVYRATKCVELLYCGTFETESDGKIVLDFDRKEKP